MIGGDILGLALSVIEKQEVEYYRNTGRTTNEIGLDVASFAAPVTLEGSLQPVPRNRYQQYGLDFQRNYVTFFVENDVQDMRRDVSGDQFTFGGKRFQCESKTDWFAIDGWVPILAVEIS